MATPLIILAAEVAEVLAEPAAVVVAAGETSVPAAEAAVTAASSTSAAESGAAAAPPIEELAAQAVADLGADVTPALQATPTWEDLELTPGPAAPEPQVIRELRKKADLLQSMRDPRYGDLPASVRVEPQPQPNPSPATAAQATAGHTLPCSTPEQRAKSPCRAMATSQSQSVDPPILGGSTTSESVPTSAKLLTSAPGATSSESSVALIVTRPDSGLTMQPLSGSISSSTTPAPPLQQLALHPSPSAPMLQVLPALPSTVLLPPLVAQPPPAYGLALDLQARPPLQPLQPLPLLPPLRQRLSQPASPLPGLAPPPTWSLGPESTSTATMAVGTPEWVDVHNGGVSQRLGLPPPAPRAVVRLGDNTIEMLGVHPTLLVNKVVAPSRESTFVRTFLPLCADNNDAFFNIAPDYSVQSHTFIKSVGGAVHLPHANAAHSLRYTAGPIATADQPNPCSVEWGPTRDIGEHQPAEIATLMAGNVPNEKMVTNLFQNFFQTPAASIPSIRTLAYRIEEASAVYDNIGLYAKLAWMALAQEVTAAVGGTAGGMGCPANASYHVSDPTTLDGIRDIINGTCSGEWVLVEFRDWTAVDLGVIQWLAQDGRRTTSAAATACATMALVHWPTVPIRLVWTGAAAPVYPGEQALPSAAAIWRFAIRLAEKRCETSQLMRAIYWCMTHAGVRAMQTAGAGNYSTIWPTFEEHYVQLPRPTPSHIVYTALEAIPADVANLKDDLHLWMSALPVARARLTALYQACYSSFLTTLCAGYNITLGHMMGWAVGQGVWQQEPNIIPLLEEQFHSPTLTSQVDNCCVLLRWPIEGFMDYMGVKVPSDYMWGRQFGRGVMGYADAARMTRVLHGQQTDVPPQWSPCSAIDDFLLVRPLEWCWPEQAVKVDMVAEYRGIGPVAKRGWHSYYGTKEYQMAALEYPEGMMSTYGIVGLNCISIYWQTVDQQYVLDTLALVQDETAPVTLEYNAAARNVNGLQFWNENHCFTPCRVPSYDWSTREVLCPGLLNAQMPLNQLGATLSALKMRCEDIAILRSSKRVGAQGAPPARSRARPAYLAQVRGGAAAPAASAPAPSKSDAAPSSAAAP